MYSQQEYVPYGNVLNRNPATLAPAQPIPHALRSANNPYTAEPFRKRFTHSEKIGYNKNYFKSVYSWLRLFLIVSFIRIR